MADIFLSYSRTDSNFMRQLRADLRAEGFTIWTDERLAPGTPVWQRAIETEIEAAHCMVVLLSPTARQSIWVAREIAYAEALGLPMYPALVAGDVRRSVPISLITVQRVDLRHDYARAVETQLVPAIRRHLESLHQAHEPQAGDNPLAELRDLLTQLYPDEGSARRVVADAGLDAARIHFGTAAINFWQSILEEAQKAGQLGQLAVVAQKEFGGNLALKAVLETLGVLPKWPEEPTQPKTGITELLPTQYESTDSSASDIDSQASTPEASASQTTSQGKPVEEDDAEDHLLETLKCLHDPEKLRTTYLANSVLVQQRMAQQPKLTVVQAITDILSETLALLEQEEPLLGDQLRGRFWERMTIRAMLDLERPMKQGKRRFYRQQKKALTLFVDLLEAQATDTISIPAQIRQAEEPPPIDFEWITIPAGNFLMGEGADQHSLFLPDYRIAKYPVTNAQYEVFVEATGYHAPKHWKDGQMPAGKEDHPVVHVSWHDAQAFCKWAKVKLPSEAEWEKAARGPNGRIYPWGDDKPDETRCNFANIGITMPVNHYPDGVSYYGCFDMVGNAWEWTNSLYMSYPYDATDGREDLQTNGRRAWRGGAFVLFDQIVRCAIRSFDNPNDHSNTLGLRVATPSLYLTERWLMGQRTLSSLKQGSWGQPPAGEPL